ncbi:RNA polymerase sigma factor for flagellar operon FliA [Actinoplanes lutulentus]|uniref:RNA polymerase sigma-28 (SigD/FliA/WhiG) subunit n=1 Tax=Actinoplanes lutulentus TaxID=1287878 RepID=A0A327ZFW2_9ACTN|nr:sigma-70 family RNA polymerase sigma factor [Actinoplanes lutulentus]MBB2942785.1 RNA polymerase sigma factor for flagellar operon FliA [Actinoplanes lutulentus]RAK38365.1 RNA polymerase sigma-28 (SigD/FliA/WhiG) subunit [Actinoplanes lutulentus]
MNDVAIAADLAATTSSVLSAKEQEELIRTNMPLVGHLVRDMLSRIPNHIHRDDLTSAGLHALVTAARGFDPERGVPFNRFAGTRIRGALLDELRSLDWATRSVRSKARTTDTTRQQLITTLGRTPTPEELAQALGTTTDDLQRTDTDVQRATVLSLQGFTTSSADDMVTERAPGPEEMLLRREQIGYLHHAIDSLPERLQTVVTEYFLRERPMADIAADLGVTESRVSQLRAEALSLLKDGLNTHLNPDMAPVPDNPESIVARRRATYYNNIATNTSMRSRLAMTNAQGHTRTLATTAA